ncbi:hypothetical protein ABTE84_19715, partial [Acinetobacter baumannii]
GAYGLFGPVWRWCVVFGVLGFCVGFCVGLWWFGLVFGCFGCGGFVVGCGGGVGCGCGWGLFGFFLVFLCFGVWCFGFLWVVFGLFVVMPV